MSPACCVRLHGACRRRTRGSAKRPSARAECPAKEAAARTDRYGDPLPDGAVARLGTVRFRHSGGFISSLVYTPDGKTLVSGGDDGTVRLWEVKSGREMLRIQDYYDASDGVAVAPDGKTAAALGSDHLVHLWDMTTGKDLRLFRPAPAASPESAAALPLSVAFAPDGKLIVAAINDDSLCVWETATGKLVWQVPEQEADAQKRHFAGACFSPDGKYVAAGSAVGGGFLWDAGSGKLQRRVGKSGECFVIAFSPDGAGLAASGQDYVVRLWDVASGREVQRYSGHKDYIQSIVFTPDGKGLVSSADDKTIRFWDVASGRETRRLEDLDWNANCLALSPDGKTLAAATGFGRSIRFWDVTTGKEQILFPGSDGPISDLAFSPDGRCVASGGFDGIIRFWDPATGKEIRRLTGQAHQDIDTLCWSPDGRRLASGAAEQPIRLWDIATGKELHRLAGKARWRCLAFFPDGVSLAVTPFDPDADFAGVWTPGSDQEPRILDGPHGPQTGGAHYIDVSPDGKWVAVVHPLVGVSLCEAASGKEVRRFGRGVDNNVGWVHFAPDGQTLFGIDNQDWFYIWSIPTGKEVRRVPCASRQTEDLCGRNVPRWQSLGRGRRTRIGFPMGHRLGPEVPVPQRTLLRRGFPVRRRPDFRVFRARRRPVGLW